jgi:hypothetical protein
LETECEGGGSQTWVTPAAAMSSTFPIIMLYHPPLCFHDSQLNPCRLSRLIELLRTGSHPHTTKIHKIRSKCVPETGPDVRTLNRQGGAAAARSSTGGCSSPSL